MEVLLNFLFYLFLPRVTFDLLLTQQNFPAGNLSTIKLNNAGSDACMWARISNFVSFGFDSHSQRILPSGFYAMTVFELVCISYYYDRHAGIKVSLK